MPIALTSASVPIAPARHDLPWRRARELAAAAAGPLAAEQVTLGAAIGRVLAVELRSAVTLPGGDTAAMDGYAVAGPPPWQVTGQVLPGQPATSPLLPGTAWEIATGALVPPGTESVVMYESCERIAGLVTAPLRPKRHIRTAGEDLRPGDLLAERGRQVTAALIGLAAHAGLDTIAVRARPRVRVLITGDEVVGHGLPALGQVRDALGPLLTALVEDAGATVAGVHHLADGAEQLRRALLAEADLVLVTGSSSKGASDHLHAVLDGLGAQLLVDGVACKPGHPQILARFGPRWVAGLPGNPYAALIGWLTVAQPLLAAMLGRAPSPARVLPVTGNVQALDEAVRLVPVRCHGDGATVVAGARPASLLAAAGADAIAVIEPQWKPGGPAELLPLG
ncbi:molybdopterin molybdotransferase [Allocatelliglobosispora scoriae]|uniref:Molybdopterin molybdenumtransferase n=1 Tax=Allocatelliglobosispora scoriae TaxID=643052 RepID=A0A841BNQ9_9ACTN|nr:molybdopterin molybdotransferase MoeA [Allocatelliglobosispora scoriae]MBB5868440.1 molybdopterin molybdotransferase [Allocatelliglobosispora scoriae]